MLTVLDNLVRAKMSTSKGEFVSALCLLTSSCIMSCNRIGRSGLVVRGIRF
ncbi:hypothetical protein HanIR_Chr14g0679051 [Helianthus annuus]|nr:hypothetical protein HanIR_Chr14g0679051 [Helianthus annuus]